MGTRKVNDKGIDYVVVAEQLSNGNWICRIDPQGTTGRYIRQPDIQTTDANTGQTTKTPGPPVEFATEQGSLDAGEHNVKLGMI